jgi:hypothetical protein
MQVPHHDDLPTNLDETQGHSRDRYQAEFLGALREAGDLMRSVGVRDSEYMVIAGGGVFLHQLAEIGESERAPTDLDIVIFNEPGRHALCSEIAHVGPLYLKNVRMVTEPRHHHGLIFTNPIVESESSAGFPVDFIAETMITVFPAGHPLMGGCDFRYPTENQRLFELARRADIQGCGEVLVAPAALIAFYKIAMQRNINGKQDNHDLVRLAELGLLAPEREDVQEVLDILTQGNHVLKVKVEEHLRGLQKFGY